MLPNAASSTRRPRYLEQDCPLTLAEGLAEYHSLMPDLLDADALQGKSRELFRHHDITHVVFGCDISFRMEGMIDTWTVFGTDVGWRDYVDYLRVPELQTLLKEVGLWRSLRETARSLPDLVRVIRHARRMRSKWPWTGHEGYLQRPLKEIRDELGITLVP